MSLVSDLLKQAALLKKTESQQKHFDYLESYINHAIALIMMTDEPYKYQSEAEFIERSIKAYNAMKNDEIGKL